MSDILKRICQSNPPKLENCPCDACDFNRMMEEYEDRLTTQDQWRKELEAERDQLKALMAKEHMCIAVLERDRLRAEVETVNLKLKEQEMHVLERGRQIDDWKAKYWEVVGLLGQEREAFGKIETELAAKAERMERAIRSIQLNRTGKNDWKGHPQKDVYIVPRRSLQVLFDSLAPESDKTTMRDGESGGEAK